jgi:hypothetical protein
MLTPNVKVSSGVSSDPFEQAGDYQISWQLDSEKEKNVPRCTVEVKWTKNVGLRSNLALYLLDMNDNELKKYTVDPFHGVSETFNCKDTLDGRVSLIKNSLLFAPSEELISLDLPALNGHTIILNIDAFVAEQQQTTRQYFE